MSGAAGREIEDLRVRRLALLDGLVAKPSGIAWAAQHSDLADEAVRQIFYRLQESHRPPDIALIATGGYGRRELSPYSDIDVTLVPLHEAHPGLEEAVKFVFRELHASFEEQLGLKVGYAFRLISDVPGLDPRTRTGLIDARLVAGSDEVFGLLMHEFWRTLPVGEFLIAKIRERESSFAKHHDTPLVVEPHLKEGAGGLRCFHCANWIGAAIGERGRRATEAYDHLLSVRNTLHAVAGKQVDFFSRQRQAEVAEALHVDVFDLMSRVAGSAAAVHREYWEALERMREARFQLSEGVVSIRGEARLQGNTRASQAAVGIALATQLELEVSTLPPGATGEVDGAEALYAIRRGERTLRNLDRAGLLDALLPELTATRTLIPNDTVHRYTVFEHSLRVVRNLDQISTNSFFGEVKSSAHDLEALYLAALLHDAGKGRRGKPHSETGEDVAREVCRRWRIGEGLGTLVAWLVREHLSMAKVIRMRDVQNPATAREFAALVEQQTRLDLLTLLTYADIAAVSDEAWTSSQESFLKELYHRTAAILQGEHHDEADPAQYRRRLLKDLRNQPVDAQDLQGFLDSMPATYVVSTPPEVVRLHLEFVREARSGKPVVDLEHHPDLGVTEVTVCSPDRPGLLSGLLGVLYAFDLSLHAIRASTTRGATPVALDVFTVSFGNRPAPPATAQQMTSAMKRVVLAERRVEELLRERGKDPDRMQVIFDFTFVEGDPGILEVRAPRGRGMAYRFSRLIAEQGWNIVAARVGQWAGRGAAAFYITGADQRRLDAEEVEAALGQRYSQPAV